MSVGLVGKKCGMTRVFNEAGVSIPVTVVEITGNRVSQVKSPDTDGYRAIQVVSGHKKASHVNKPLAGHMAKAGVEAGSHIREYRLSDDEMPEVKAGDAIGLDVFSEGQFVDVRGTSKGKGFQGGVKRHNFSMQDATHGNSISHRAIGSTGQCQTPGRVLKGKKMPGQMGNKKRCVPNLEIVKIDADKNIILIKGGVPGAPGGDVLILPTTKTKKGAK